MRLLLASILVASNLYAQELETFVDPGRAQRVTAVAPVVEQLFRNHWSREHLPGLVYGVVLDGALLISGGFGSANLVKNIPADAKSLFRIASMTKSFTALAILQLRDAGKLRLDDPVSDYLPEMKGQNLPTTDAPAITIRHLLTHSAGFPEDNPWGDRQLADSDEELRELVRRGISFSNVPGIEFEYSNLGFALPPSRGRTSSPPDGVFDVERLHGRALLQAEKDVGALADLLVGTGVVASVPDALVWATYSGQKERGEPNTTYIVEDAGNSREWCRISTYGGKLAENITQAVCRDLLAEAIVRVEAAGFPVVLHVHDEIVAEGVFTVKDRYRFWDLLTRDTAWAEGFPIAASCWLSARYIKG